MDMTTSVEETVASETIPSEYELFQNYPNPFNPTTAISYSVVRTSNVQLSVYNLLGQKITTLVDGVKNPGKYSIVWNAVDLPSGVYVYRLEVDNVVRTRKMTLLR
jgi:hypothetical protein